MKSAPYLQFDGDCAAAMTFYAECFHTAPEIFMTYGQSPMGAQMAEQDRAKVMHSEVAIGQTRLMGSDVVGRPYTPAAGFHIAIAANSVEEAEQLFAALSGGGVVEMPMQETFWAARFGAVTDKFGKPWMVSFER